MKCKILHENHGRMRIQVLTGVMNLHQADMLEFWLKSLPGVRDASVSDRTNNALITYTCSRQELIRLLSEFSFADEKNEALVPEHTSREENRYYQDKIAGKIMRRYIKKILLPLPVRHAISLVKSVPYIIKGLKCLLHGQIRVAVLDAAAIGVSLIRGDFSTASSVMFLLEMGDILDEWTHKKSVADLAMTMSLNVDKAWLHRADEDVLVDVSSLKTDDIIVVRTSGMIPVDGIVVSGESSVNQAAMTGESEPVIKREGSAVYAGTVVEEGECLIRVTNASGNGRYDRIVHMIEESEKLKSATESRASTLADKLVPYSFLGTILTYLITRNAARAISVLMVDYSCALKLSMPITVLSAMNECGRSGITVKGGKFMEAVADADTVVFDKTGTLTHANPSVSKIVTFGGFDENEALRIAACLEEHYPHSMANAVVAEAIKRNVIHDEMHSSVEYVVAHGIASCINNQKAVIGSYHFVFEDEGVEIPEDERERFEALPAECSQLYLAISGKLAAAICIEDPVRADAAEVVSRLHELGVSQVVMMTGDNERTAHSVAERVGVDRYFSEVLPEDKAAFIREEHSQGRKVIMIGDGVNDSPALSEADAGIAISSGAAIAREIADITITAGDLYELVHLKMLSDRLMERINYNYRSIMTFNTALILLGVLGILPPATSALLHNTSTILITLSGMRPLLEE